MYKVLVVEDEDMVRKGIVMTIDWAGLNCQVAGEAENGQEGVKKAESLKPDLVITDLKMPRMDGVEMIAQLRSRGCQARFIILTAFGDFKFAQSALRLGVSDYLLKPLKEGDLEQALRRIISQMEGEVKTEKQEEASSVGFYLPKRTGNKYVDEAIRYISEHYMQDITISTVADYLEISEGYLSRVFKRETDYTFTSYLSHYRIEAAMELLKNCRVKVYEVADKVGFGDTAWFSAQFKKILGISPSEYQDRCEKITEKFRITNEK